MNTIRNSVQLTGNLGTDVELIQLESGTKLAKLSMATNDYYIDKKGEKVQETQWHKIVAWGKLGENMHKILKKGHEITLKGKLEYNSYKNKDGNTQYISQIKALEFIKLSKNTEAENLPF